MTSLGWIWIIFILIFISLACINFFRSTKKISAFQLRERPMKNAVIIIKGKELDEPLKEFITDISSYIENLNNSNSLQNIIAGFGYVAAALVALFSLFLELQIIK